MTTRSSAFDHSEALRSRLFRTVMGKTTRLAEVMRLKFYADGVLTKQLNIVLLSIRISMEQGDLLLEINGSVPKRAAVVNTILKKALQYWRFKLNRDGQIIRQRFQ